MHFDIVTNFCDQYLIIKLVLKNVAIRQKFMVMNPKINVKGMFSLYYHLPCTLVKYIIIFTHASAPNSSMN